MMLRLLPSLLTLALLATGCSGLRAQASDVFITREATVHIQTPPTETGETILMIENNDDAEHRPVILRLDEGVEVTDLPMTGEGTIDIGRPIDLEYRGEGYQVVEKLDTMRPYYGSDQRIQTTVHVYLRPGRYAIVDNLPGGVAAGTHATFEVTA